MRCGALPDVSPTHSNACVHDLCMQHGRQDMPGPQGWVVGGAGRHIWSGINNHPSCQPTSTRRSSQALNPLSLVSAMHINTMAGGQPCSLLLLCMSWLLCMSSAMPAELRKVLCLMVVFLPRFKLCMLHSSPNKHLQVQVCECGAVLQQQVHQLPCVAALLVEPEALQGQLGQGWPQQGLQQLQVAQAAC